uniref:Conotoxin superfamily O1 n=1 Tax=Conus ermineus TaxID=55423 RepID=A0A346CIQ5_CONER|nr:conotoxin precursor superfamily O1 [Conus ermineus]
MKLTCMMIVAVLFLTAWTFVTADDPRDGLENRRVWGKLLSMTRDEMKNPEAPRLIDECGADGAFCFLPGLGLNCCSGLCLIVCVST